MQFANKKKVKTRAAEPVPHDPELDAKIKEVDDMAESQIDDKLQAMLVSPVNQGWAVVHAQFSVPSPLQNRLPMSWLIPLELLNSRVWGWMVQMLV